MDFLTGAVIRSKILIKNLSHSVDTVTCFINWKEICSTQAT